MDKEPKAVELATADGEPIGVTVTFKPKAETVDREPGETDEHHRLRTIAKNIAGWSALTVDGEKVPFSQERAIGLMQRFPHFATQLGKA